MYSFNFLGKDSFLDFGIAVEKRPPIPKPERNIDYVDIPGRSGSLKVDYKTYKDIIIPIQCWYIGKDDVVEKADEIKAWLDGGEGDLILSNQPDKKYIAHVSGEIDITQEMRVLGEFLVNFRCQPFKYLVSNDVITLTSTPSTVNNIGTVAAQPVVKIYGTGDIDLTVNAAVIHLTCITDYITIDSVLMDAYKDTALMNANMNGEFPILQAGANVIEWTGTVDRIEITPNWRWL